MCADPLLTEGAACQQDAQCATGACSGTCLPFQKILRHVSEANIQAQFDAAVDQRYRAVWLDTYYVGNTRYYNQIFELDTAGKYWQSYGGLDAAGVTQILDNLPNQYRPRQLDAYPNGASIAYSLIVEEASGPQWAYRLARTDAQANSDYTTLNANDFWPVNLAVALTANGRRISTIYHKGVDIGSHYFGLDQNGMQDVVDYELSRDSRYLFLDVDIDTNGVLQYAPVFDQVDEEWGAWGGLSGATFDTYHADFKAEGWRLKVIRGYNTAQGVRYVGVWSE